MKFLLSILICTQVAGNCLPPYSMPEAYTNGYDCMMAGYNEAIKKMKEMVQDRWIQAIYLHILQVRLH